MVAPWWFPFRHDGLPPVIIQNLDGDFPWHRPSSELGVPPWRAGNPLSSPFKSHEKWCDFTRLPGSQAIVGKHAAGGQPVHQVPCLNHFLGGIQSLDLPINDWWFEWIYGRDSIILFNGKIHGLWVNWEETMDFTIEYWKLPGHLPLIQSKSVWHVDLAWL